MGLPTVSGHINKSAHIQAKQLAMCLLLAKQCIIMSVVTSHVCIHHSYACRATAQPHMMHMHDHHITSHIHTAATQHTHSIQHTAQHTACLSNTQRPVHVIRTHMYICSSILMWCQLSLPLSLSHTHHDGRIMDLQTCHTTNSHCHTHTITSTHIVCITRISTYTYNIDININIHIHITCIT